MFSRPKHPFFKQILEQIPAQGKVNSVVYKLGPGFLTNQFRVYNNITNDVNKIDDTQLTSSPYFYKGKMPDTHNDGIYVANTRYFMDSPSPALKGTAESRCKSKSPGELAKRMCFVISNRGYFRSPGNFTFLSHLWSHTWSNANVNKKYTFISVKNMTNLFTNYLVRRQT